MSSELQIDFGNLEKLLAVFDAVGEDSVRIRDYANEWVCSKEGFDYDLCALQPIADMMPTLQGYFTDLDNTFSQRWSGLRSAVVVSAKEIDLVDGEVNAHFLNLGAGLARDGGAPNVADALEKLSLTPAEVDLSEPENGGQQLESKHDDRFQAAAETWDKLRDAINEGISGINWAIDKANDAGIGIPTIAELDTRSLSEMIVYPLSGNYEVIQRNGNACTIMGEAMRNWGTNFSLMSGKVVLAMRGEASGGLVVQLNAYGLVMRMVGTGIKQGESVYKWIAQVAERIAIVVEKVMVKMTQKLAKLSAKIASKSVPVFGWALLAKDLVTKGFGAITDIWDDIQEVRQMIEDCRALVDEVEQWAQVAADRLKVFEQIVAMVEELPTAHGGRGVDALKANMDRVRKNLGDVPDFDQTVSGAEDSLNGALGSLEGQHEDEEVRLNFPFIERALEEARKAAEAAEAAEGAS